MKHWIRYSFLLIGMVLGSLSALEASHAMGADLTYTYIGPNQYRIHLSFYRDCTGILPSTAYNISAVAPSCGFSTFVTVNQTSFVEVSPLCAASLPNSTCNGGTLPGVQEYQYEAIITLPGACTDWSFAFTDCCRNSGITTLSFPGSESIFVPATLNNVAAPTNNSPVFTSLPVPYICAGQSYIYNHGAVDPDGDSLVFVLINALNGPSSSVTYNGGFSGLSPMTSVPAVTINSTNGNVTMNPTGPQIAVIAVQVLEYRNGVLIGSTVRDIQVTVLNCTNNSPVINPIFGVVNATQTGPYSIQVCPGQTLSFTIPGTDIDGGQNITWTWNNGIPGGVFVGSSGTSPQNATFTWTPTGADVGLNALVVQLQDNGCPVIGSQTRAIDITVLQGTTAGPDLIYCVGGGPVQLGAIGGTSFTWNVLSGTPGSLSCTNCANPTAAPAVATTYQVVSNLPGPCRNRDTVVVTPAPSFSLTMGPAQTICTGGSANLLATPNPVGSYTYAWSPGTGLSSTSISNPSANPGATTNYTVSVTSPAGCRVVGTQSVTVSPAILSIAPTASPTQSCAGTPVTLNANPATGDCNQYTVANIAFAPTAIVGTTVSLGDDQVSSAVPIGFNFNFFCSTFSQIYISSNGFVTFNASSGSGCCSGTTIPTGTITDFIAGTWNDLYPPAGGTIRYATTGTTPNRIFIVDFNSINHCCSAGPINTFQIKLFESSNFIEVHSTTITDDGSTHTQGIQGPTVGYAVPGRDGTNFTANNDAYRFAPLLPTGFTVSWQAPLGTTVATGTTASVTPSATTTYFAVATNGVCSTTASVTVDVANVNAGPDLNVCPAGNNASLNAIYTGPTPPGNCSTYTVSSIPFVPVAAAGTSVVLGDDQVSSAIPIGFNFNFYCQAKTQVYISSNGFITFNAASGSGCCSGSALPTGTITDFIAGTWNDLYPPAGGSILYQTSGGAPNRVFTVTYSSINHCCSAGPINTFQIRLFETTNNIEIHSTTITDDGSTHTMGIQDASGTNFLIAPGRGGTNWTATNEAYRFAPVLGGVIYSWSPATFLSSTTISNPTAIGVTAPTTYTISVNNGTCIVTDIINITICLPVDNLQLDAEKQAERVKLHWDAQNEQSLSHYVIERSSDGSTWSELGTVQAIGQPNAGQSYQSFDTKPLGGVNYYRLRVIDLNGGVNYSNQVDVFFEGEEWVHVSPNPGRNVFVFEVGKVKEGDLVIDIFNVEGQAVQTLEKKDCPAGVHKLTANLGELSAGIYLYRVRTGAQELNGRLLKID